jgi:hypothetical protein
MQKKKEQRKKMGIKFGRKKNWGWNLKKKTLKNEP